MIAHGFQNGQWSKNVLDFLRQHCYIIRVNTKHGDNMNVGDLVVHKNYDGSIGVIKHRCTWTCEIVWAVYWFYHYYDTGHVSPIYDWEVEVVNGNR